MSFFKEKQLDKDKSEIFITEFPKEGFGIIDQLQGRVQFAILEQIKLMKTSGMEDKEISEIILANVQKIIENYQSQD
ncbi:MAG: hypothetical protein HY476_04765 [Nitrosarchaeum sp.]|nr:hypothetical protein [Nitrosarchaeum sp.]